MHRSSKNIRTNESQQTYSDIMVITQQVIRDVISVHSEELARQWKEEEDDEKESLRSDHSSHRYFQYILFFAAFVG